MMHKQSTVMPFQCLLEYLVQLKWNHHHVTNTFHNVMRVFNESDQKHLSMFPKVQISRDADGLFKRLLFCAFNASGTNLNGVYILEAL